MAKNKEEKEACKLTVISETTNINIEKLINIYKEDRRKAKIIFDNNNNIYNQTRICLFEYANGDFRIGSLTRKYGISTNAVIYSRESNNWVISYKHKTKSFYFIDKFKKLRMLTMNILNAYCNDINFSAYNYLLNKFGWIRNLNECKHVSIISFNTIVKHKLYNEKEVLKHIFKCPYPVAKMLSENHGQYSPWDFIKIWKQAKKVLINVENLKPEFLNSPYFFDTTKMASTLGKKVNCSWGLKRLLEEHDNFSKEITNTILEFEELRELNVREVYKDFAVFSGFELLLTNHDLIAEGKVMSHCVGTYSSQVNTGKSGIYRYKGHTLELAYRKQYGSSADEKKRLCINQYMGFKNKQAPDELMNEVKDIVNNFNKTILEYDDDEVSYNLFQALDDDLPF